MNRGDKVRLVGMVSDRGTVLNSVRDEFRDGTLGRITAGPCPVGWYAVQFATVPGGAMQVPRELLIRVRAT